MLARSMTLAVLLCLAAGSAHAQGDGLVGRYYSNFALVDTVITFSEADFVFERIDASIDFWTAPPNRNFRWQPAGLPPDRYGVSWTGYLRIDVPGEYAFGTLSDDGSQVWINGQLVVDNYEPQWWDWEDCLIEGSQTGIGPSGYGRAETFPGYLDLAAGYHAIEVRFYEEANYDGIELWWLLPDAGPSDIPYYGTTYHGTAISANPATNWNKVPQSVLHSSLPATGVETGVPSARVALFVAPNPFNPRTTISFSSEMSGPAEISTFDMVGRRVRRLWSGIAGPDTQNILWDGRDDSGHEIPSGVYFVRAKGVFGSEVRKVTLLR